MFYVQLERNSHNNTLFMIQSLRLFFPILIILLISSNLFATHNRAGEITYEQVGDLTIIATVTTYTKASSIPADRDSLEVCWGDGNCQWVVRSNGPLDGDGIPQGELLANDTKKNLYITTYTYAGQAHYTISMTDPNRNGGICNVNQLGSDNVPFHLETTVTFFNPQVQGYNSSPILLQPPIDIGCIGQPFIHNPNAYDPDGDSLSYHLIVPLQDVGLPVPNYDFPDQYIPGSDNNIDLNEITGDFIWEFPQEACEYNIAMIIVEYRNGIPIDTLIRDMQVLIEDCDNEPPVVETVDELCVVAGELIEFEVVGTAPIEEADQLVALSALGGPFILDFSPAEFDVAPGYNEQPLTGVFRWQTSCEHISDQPYSVVFKAVDNFFGDNGLFSLKTVRITVVGPPVEDVQAEADAGQVKVSWEKPYICEDAEEDYFFDFSVWRKEGSNQFLLDTCVGGLDGQGYQKIEFDTINTIENNRYTYLDTEVERGRTYCYRVLAEFAKRTPPPSNIPYNKVESLASNEFCVQLNRDIPLITNVDVLSTDQNNGSIEVRWAKPVATDLDTLLNPGPYTYELYRATGMTENGLTAVPGAVWTSNTFFNATDTIYVDNGLNTLDNAYSYHVAFYINGDYDNGLEPLGFTNAASSVYLNIASTDETNNLSWEELVPWDNYVYTIYRQNEATLLFDSIGTTFEQMYSDTDLLNGREYCYKIRSTGSYGIEGVINPIFNFSQENCGTPIDTIPPCPPILDITNICDSATEGTPEESFLNNLTWTNPMNFCEETDDVVSYNVYYAPNPSADFITLATDILTLDTFFMHQPDVGIAGCYAVTAIDTFANESVFSNIFCVDNCPEYILPNVFTPNGDGANELFIPYPYRFINSIEINIFNRWGNLVFQSTNPDINWDGKTKNGEDVAEGTYYYTCKVFENRVNGIEQNPEVLNGWIEVIR